MKEKKQSNIEMGERIQQARQTAGLTQEQLAEAIDVTPQYLSDLERGAVGTSIPTLKSLCDTLLVSSDFILFGRSDPNDISLILERIRYLPEEQILLVEKYLNFLLEALRIGSDK